MIFDKIGTTERKIDKSTARMRGTPGKIGATVAISTWTTASAIMARGRGETVSVRAGSTVVNGWSVAANEWRTEASVENVAANIGKIAASGWSAKGSAWSIAASACRERVVATAVQPATQVEVVGVVDKILALLYRIGHQDPHPGVLVFPPSPDTTAQRRRFSLGRSLATMSRQADRCGRMRNGRSTRLFRDVTRNYATIASSLALLGGSLLSGCQATLPDAHQFPSTWPGSQPLGEHAPTVSVQPILLNLARADTPSEEREGLPTAAVLSVLLIKYLQVNGVNAVLEPADASTAKYALTCTVPRLGYTVQQAYPQKRLYQAELACTVKDQETQTVVWERRLSQQYEQASLLNLLTKLPQPPHKHERILFRECVMPLWDAMASSVGAVVVGREQRLSRPPADHAS